MVVTADVGCIAAVLER